MRPKTGAGSPWPRSSRSSGRGCASSSGRRISPTNNSRTARNDWPWRTPSPRFRSRTLAEWEGILETESLPITGVKRVSEVVRDPHVKARALLPVVDVSGLWKVQVIAHQAKHTASETRNPARVPAKGQDTVEIL